MFNAFCVNYRGKCPGTDRDRAKSFFNLTYVNICAGTEQVMRFIKIAGTVLPG